MSDANGRVSLCPRLWRTDDVLSETLTGEGRTGASDLGPLTPARRRGSEFRLTTSEVLNVQLVTHVLLDESEPVGPHL